MPLPRREGLGVGPKRELVGTDGWQVQYALFSREGFTDAAFEMARELDVRLVTLKDMEKTFEDIYAGSRPDQFTGPDHK